MKKTSTHYFILAVMFLGAIVFWSCNDSTNTPTETKTEITGIISDEQENPVPNAVIEAYSAVTKSKSAKAQSEETVIYTDTTDEDGNYTLRNLPEDLTMVEVRISHPDFKQFHDLIKNIMKNINNGKHPVLILHNDDCCGKMQLTVKDKTSGVPLKDVEIRLNRGKEIIRKAKTNADGYLEYTNICINSYWIRVAREGYKVIEQEINIENCDDPYQITLEMTALGNEPCCKGIIKVSALDADTKEIIKGAKVVLWSGGKIIATKYTESEFAEFTNLCEGLYGVDISRDGYKHIEFNAELGCDETLSFTQELLKNDCCLGVVNLLILDEKLQLVEGVKVKLWSGSTVIREGFTDLEGGIAFDKICEGKYQISFMKDGFKGQEFNFEIGCNQTVDFTKTILKLDDDCCKGIIKVFPKDYESGEPLNGAKVILWKDGKAFRDRTVDGGVAGFDGLCQGVYVISIEKEGYNPLEFKVELGCNKTLEFEKKLIQKNEDCCKGIIKIYPKDNTSGEPLNGATVNLWKDGKLFRTTKVINGMAGFDGLCEGRYGVDVIAEGHKAIEFVVELGCNETKEFEKKLVLADECCKGVIKVIVRDDKTGELMKYGVVKLWQGGKVIKEVKISEGLAIFENLCEGKYGINISAEGYKGAEASVELGCNATKEIEKRLILSDDCCKGVIKVFPKDEQSGESLNGASVKLYKDGKLLETAKVVNGVAAFDGLCEGKYLVVVTAEGYKSIEFEIELGCNKTMEFVKKLAKNDECCKGVIKVYPKDNDSNEPINGATVKLWKDGKLFKEGKVVNGVAVFENLCEGRYEISIIAEGYKGIEFVQELGCNKTVEIVKKLLKNDECCKGKIKIYPKDNDTNEPLNGATVRLWKDGKLFKEAKVVNGVAIFENMCEGKYGVDVIAEGHKAIEFSVELGCNKVIELEKKLLKNEDCCKGIVKVFPKDFDTNLPLNGATVKIYLGGKLLETLTVVEGKVIFDGLCQGNYVIVISKDGYDTIEYQFELGCNKTLEQVKTLKKKLE